MTAVRHIVLCAVFAAASAAAACSAAAGESFDALAAAAVRAAGTDQGLCLVLGDDGGKLTAALAKNSRMYVQGSTRNAAGIEAARKALVDAGVALRASIAWRETDGLPYTEDLVNLIVVSGSGEGVAAAEILRVLAPGGAAVLTGAGGAADALKKAGAKEIAGVGGGLAGFTKPGDPRFDVWSHNLGGPDQSYTNDDGAVAPWKELRWINEPRWGALYTSYSGRVTAGGRLYYKENRIASGGIQTWLIARDAWNGCDLWRVPAGSVWRKTFDHFDETLTCDDGRVYDVEDKVLVARDGRSGRKLLDYSPGFTPEVAAAAGAVLLVSGKTRSAALDKESGKVLWARPCVAHPAAEDGTAFVLTAAEIEGVDLASGASRWKVKAASAPGNARVFCKAGVVYAAYQPPWKPVALLAAYDAKAGALLWKQEAPKYNYGIFPYPDELWLLDRDNAKKNDQVFARVLDPRTGKEKRAFQVKGAVMGKCFPSKGTGDYMLFSNGWYLERKSGLASGPQSIRSPCQIGQMPANGLSYYFPHHCDCQVTLRGMLALASPGSRKWLPDGAEGGPRLFASGAAPAAAAEGPADWPMYRRDTRRSNAFPGELPAGLTPLWSEKLGEGRLTQATVAYGMVYAAERGAQRIHARDAASGKAVWSFVADGRVEYPPALHRGLCLFGTGAGSVYALDARTGKEVWRLRAAPAEKYVAEESQFASAWPVVGGVMPMNGDIFFTCGRSSSADGGMWTYGVESASGKVRWRQHAGTSGDMFASDGKDLLLTLTAYRPDTGARLLGAKKYPGLLQTTRYLTAVSIADFMACVEPSLSNKKHIELTDGRIKGDCLAFSEKLSVAGWRYAPGVPGWKDKDKEGKWFVHAAGSAQWNLHDVKQHLMGIVVAGERVYAVGRPTSYDAKDKSELWVLSAADGKNLQTLPLEGVPVYDGLSAAGGKLYLATEDGRLVCFGAK